MGSNVKARYTNQESASQKDKSSTPKAMKQEGGCYGEARGRMIRGERPVAATTNNQMG